MLSEISQIEFNKFRNSLIKYSRRYRIQFEDLEEIVNDSILKAWKYFDDDRGSFESLCLVIIKNKILNFIRGNFNLFILVLIDENEDYINAEDITFEKKEKIEMAKNYILKFKNRLNEEELILFNEIYRLCETSNKVSISEASNNVGLRPAKGWDLFRKIQRKARRDGPQFQKSEPLGSREFSDIGADLFVNEPLILYNQVEISQDENLNQLLSRFSEYDLKKLNSIYNF